MTTQAIASRLRDLRKSCGLSQRVLAEASGVGEKSLSSFETGSRTGTIKLEQLDAYVKACGSSLREFFRGDDETVEGTAANDEAITILMKLDDFPPAIRMKLANKMRLMMDSAEACE